MQVRPARQNAVSAVRVVRGRGEIGRFGTIDAAEDRMLNSTRNPENRTRATITTRLVTSLRRFALSIEVPSRKLCSPPVAFLALRKREPLTLRKESGRVATDLRLCAAEQFTHDEFSASRSCG